MRYDARILATIQQMLEQIDNDMQAVLAMKEEHETRFPDFDLSGIFRGRLSRNFASQLNALGAISKAPCKGTEHCVQPCLHHLSDQVRAAMVEWAATKPNPQKALVDRLRSHLASLKRDMNKQTSAGIIGGLLSADVLEISRPIILPILGAVSGRSCFL